MEEKLRADLEGNGEFLFLEDDIWAMGSHGDLPLEEILLDLPISQWMVMVMVLEAKNSKELWEQIRGHLGSIQTRNDIRYDYFQMHDSNQLMSSGLDLDYEMMGEIFAYFAESNLAYARKIYSNKTFEEAPELLPEHCRAALEIEKMLSCEETDWNGRLEYLGKAVKIWPEMGETVKNYARLLGEQQEKIEDQAQKAKSELQIMAEQIKGQVKIMLENGMKDQALGIVKQLRQMLPDDREVIKLEKELEK